MELTLGNNYVMSGLFLHSVCWCNAIPCVYMLITIDLTHKKF